MTSKAVISQLEVNERRLKGIYDQLEGGNFKKAIFEAEKVLKKNSNLLPAKVLKGLALFRLGKSIEAYNLIDEVAKLTPTDENTLNSLSYFYKESNQKTKIVDIYEEAYKKCPNREDICANLFYCHTKNFDFVSQQKIATQLKKINVNHIEYVMWPIISNVLNGVYNNDERLIKLGEAILARYLNSNSILTVEIIEFFMYTLEKSNKLLECLEWLKGPVLRDVTEHIQNKELFNRYKISILLKLDRKLETCDLYWESLENNRDDICIWRDYIDVVVHLNLDKENTHSIICVIEKLKTIDQPSMAIKVAIIHMSIELEKANHKDILSEFGGKNDKIIEYFSEFGDKPSCLYDIYSLMALDNFSNEDRCEIIKKISEHTGQLSIENITNNKDVERFVSVEILRRAVDNGNKSDIQLLIVIYEHGLQFSTDISCSEIKPCDNFVKLVASHYYDEWLNNKDNCTPLIDAIVLLKRAVDQSSANYHLRLQLSHLLGIIGCSDLLINQFNELEIKQLMWDSLGYFYILPMLSVPSFHKRIQFFKRNIDRKHKNKIEIEDSLVTCYKLGNYSKIPEIIEFHRDIDSSIMSCFSELEILYINTILKSNNCDELFECFTNINVVEVESPDVELNILAQYSKLKDFRDLQTSPDFCQFDKMWNEKHQKMSFDNILLWASQRVLIVRTFYAAAKFNMESVVKLDRVISDNNISFASDISNHYKIIISCRQQLIEIWDKLEDMKDSYNPLSTNLTGCIEPPQKIFTKAYIDTIIACIDSMTLFHDSFVRRIDSVTLIDWSITMVSPLQSIIDELVNNNDIDCQKLFIIVPYTLAKLTLICELISWITLTLALLENMTKPLKPKVAGKRRNKKKKAEATVDSMSDSNNEQLKSFLETTNFNKLPHLFMNMIGKLESFVSRMKSAVSSSMEKNDPMLDSICNSWIMLLDDSINFINVKKIHVDNVRRLLEEETTVQCLCDMHDLSVNHHH